MLTTLAPRLLKCRLSRRLSTRQVEKGCGVAFANIHRYEADKRAPSVENLYKLARFYGVSVDWLLGLREEA